MSSSEGVTSAAVHVFVPDVEHGGPAEFCQLRPVQSAEQSETEMLSIGALRERMREQILLEARAEAERELQRRATELEKELQQQLGSLRDELRRQTRQSLEEISQHALRLALEMAERIVRRASEADPELLERALRETLEQIESKRGLRLRVHPTDARSLARNEELLKDMRIAELTPDPSLSPGGCVVEAGERSWDLSLESQLEQLRQALAPLWESNR